MSSKAIRAGEAYVELGGRDQRLREVLDRAEKRLRGFAGSAGAAGEQVGQKFGAKVLGGLTMFFGVAAIDNAMGALAERMKQASVDGRSLGFEEIGQAIGSSILDGLRNVPVFGSLMDLSAQIADAVVPWGGSLNDEDRLAKVEQQRQKLMSIMQRVQSERDKLGRDGRTGGDALRAEREDFETMLGERLNELIGAGQTLDQARAAVGELRAEFEAIMSAKADKALKDAAEQIQGIGGGLSASEQSARMLASQIERVRNALIAAGRANEIPEQTAAIERQFAAAMAAKEAAKIDSVLGSIERRREEFGLSEVELLRRELQALGAEASQVERAVALSSEMTRLEENANRLKEIEEILGELREASATEGLSQAQLLERRLRALGATAEQIAEAMALTTTATATPEQITSSFTATGSFDAAVFGNLGSGAAFDRIADATTQTERNTRRTAELLSSGVGPRWE